MVSRIDAEKMKEDFDEATAKLKQLRQTYLLRRQSATAALRLLEIQRESKQLAVDHANKNADLLAIHAPNDGLVVVNSTFKSSGFSEWQNGDQVRAGAAFMQVVESRRDARSRPGESAGHSPNAGRAKSRSAASTHIQKWFFTDMLISFRQWALPTTFHRSCTHS